MPKNILVNARDLRLSNRNKNKEIRILKDIIYEKNVKISKYNKKNLEICVELEYIKKKYEVIDHIYNNLWCRFMNVKRNYEELLGEFVEELIENEEN